MKFKSLAFLSIVMLFACSLVVSAKETSLIAIDGSVYYDDGLTLVPNGWQVSVTNEARTLSQSSNTGDAGSGRYSVTFIDFAPGAVVAATDDEIELVVTDSDGNKHSKTYVLTDANIDASSATVDVVTDVFSPPVSSALLAIEGTVFLKDGTEAPDGWEVKVENKTQKLSQSSNTGDAGSGRYSVTFITFDPEAIVAATGDEIVIVVTDADGNRRASLTDRLATNEVLENKVTIDVVLDVTQKLTLTLAPGLNMISIPLANSQATVDAGDPVGIEKMGDVKTLLGENTTVYYYNPSEGKYEEAPVELEVTGDLGLVVMLLEETTIIFEGEAWPGEINLVPGLNLFAVPLDSDQTQTVGDLKALLGGNPPIHYYDIAEGMFEEAEDTLVIEGGVGYVTMLLEGITLSIDGVPWQTEMQAPFIGKQLYAFDPTSTPLMEVKGTVINHTGSAVRDLSVTVRHLSSDTVITDTTGNDGQFSAVFLDVFNNQSFRVGDVFKIDIHSNNSDVRIEAIQYTITQEEVKLGRIILGNLAAQTIPKHSKLMQNWPNPFNPETWIPFQLSKAADVTITIYDMHGRLVRRFDLGYTPAGIYNTKFNAIYWNGTNDAGERVSSGVYFYHIQAGEFSASRKMVILK
jgi:hypothetical protein